MHYWKYGDKQKYIYFEPKNSSCVCVCVCVCVGVISVILVLNLNLPPTLNAYITFNIFPSGL